MSHVKYACRVAVGQSGSQKMQQRERLAGGKRSPLPPLPPAGCGPDRPPLPHRRSDWFQTHPAPRPPVCRSPAGPASLPASERQAIRAKSCWRRQSFVRFPFPPLAARTRGGKIPEGSPRRSSCVSIAAYQLLRQSSPGSFPAGNGPEDRAQGRNPAWMYCPCQARPSKLTPLRPRSDCGILAFQPEFLLLRTRAKVSPTLSSPAGWVGGGSRRSGRCRRRSQVR